MGRARVLLFLYSYKYTYGGPTTCLALTKNVPTPPPPGHPAQHVPDQVPQKLTKSPESDRTMCPGVSGSSPPPPETSWLPGSRRPPQVAMCPWVLIPHPPPPGQAHTQDLHNGGLCHSQGPCPHSRENSYQLDLAGCGTLGRPHCENYHPRKVSSIRPPLAWLLLCAKL